MTSFASPNSLAGLAAIRLPIGSVSFTSNSTTTEGKSNTASNRDTLAPAHAGPAARLSRKTAKSGRIVAKAMTVSRTPLPPGLTQTHGRTAGSNSAAATDATIPGPRPIVGATNTRTIQEQVAAATSVAERMTIATARAALKANNGDGSTRSETAEDGRGLEAASASANNTVIPVAVVMARLDIGSVSELTGKTIAIDDRYSAYNGSVRTAIEAAGAPEVQLSEGQTTAINRLVGGEVPAAVLTLVSAEAAESFPEIAGFRIFHVPLSPRSLMGRP
jgi:hypothetical protein